jgi:hypothetical protein
MEHPVIATVKRRDAKVTSRAWNSYLFTFFLLHRASADGLNLNCFEFILPAGFCKGTLGLCEK